MNEFCAVSVIKSFVLKTAFALLNHRINLRTNVGFWSRMVLLTSDRFVSLELFSILLKNPLNEFCWTHASDIELRDKYLIWRTITPLSHNLVLCPSTHSHTDKGRRCVFVAVWTRQAHKMCKNNFPAIDAWKFVWQWFDVGFSGPTNSQTTLHHLRSLPLQERNQSSMNNRRWRTTLDPNVLFRLEYACLVHC